MNDSTQSENVVRALRQAERATVESWSRLIGIDKPLGDRCFRYSTDHDIESTMNAVGHAVLKSESPYGSWWYGFNGPALQLLLDRYHDQLDAEGWPTTAGDFVLRQIDETINAEQCPNTYKVLAIAYADPRPTFRTATNDRVWSQERRLFASDLQTKLSILDNYCQAFPDDFQLQLERQKAFADVKAHALPLKTIDAAVRRSASAVVDAWRASNSHSAARNCFDRLAGSLTGNRAELVEAAEDLLAATTVGAVADFEIVGCQVEGVSDDRLADSINGLHELIYCSALARTRRIVDLRDGPNLAPDISM